MKYALLLSIINSGGGGSLSLEAVPDAREKKRCGKRVIQIRGGRGTRRGCQTREKWGGGGGEYPNRYGPSSIHASMRGKGR